MTKTRVTVGGRTLMLSNLDKVMYPAAGLAKAGVIDYYRRVAHAMLPHLAGRPITLKRYPDGVRGPSFYEKRCPSFRPDWLETVRLPGEEESVDHCLVEGLADLVWIANLASLEVHALLSTAEDLLRPTVVAFDLDPGAPATVVDCARTALVLRDVLAGVGLESFAKTSGGKGLHVYVPLNTPATFEKTRAFARATARTLERDDPERVTSGMDRAARRGKVFVDWSQNSDFKTTVVAYSLRALERPRVSTPLRWDEVEEAAGSGDAAALTFEIDAVLERVSRRGDLFRGVLETKQRLPGAGPTGKGATRHPSPGPAGASGKKRARRGARGRKRS